jgi:hypothetical protein
MEIKMNTSTIPLSIYIHLEDGRVAKFAQPDAPVAKQVIRRIQPNKLFSEPSLILGGDQATVVFQTSKVVRVDLVTDIDVHWPYPNHVVDAQEITEEEFQKCLQQEEDRAKYPEWIPSISKLVMVLAEVELVSGARIFLKILTRQFNRMPLDESISLHHFFALGGLHARRCGGGVMLVNPASIVRFAFYSGPVALPPGVWQASYVSG